MVVAGYGVTQDKVGVSDFAPGKAPWVLKGVFCPCTVLPGTDGLPGVNSPWLPEFRAAQQHGI